MPITRRKFVKSLATTAGAAGLVPIACRRVLGAELKGGLAATAAEAKLTFCAPLTHSDWMLKPGIHWGPEGVHHMLDACKACGWSRVHWRALDGGRANYASKI